MAVGEDFNRLVGGAMGQQLSAPIEQVDFAWIELRGALIRPELLRADLYRRYVPLRSAAVPWPEFRRSVKPDRSHGRREAKDR